jgi:dCMP deaminase
MKDKYIRAYIDMAERFAQTSEAVRLKVGCLIVKPEGGTIAEGVNGMPPGWPTEVCENVKHDWGTTLVTKPECRHAEVAALEKLWFSPVSAEGCYMFISHSPCLPCAIKIATAKISRVYYKHNYRSVDGIMHLEQRGIKVEQVVDNKQ